MKGSFDEKPTFDTFAIMGVAISGLVYVPIPACKNDSKMLFASRKGEFHLVINHLMLAVILLEH
jgi:hypothetical protein